MSIEDRVRDILCDLLLLRPEQVKNESLLIDDLDLDSLAFIEMAFAIEKEFAVDFPDVKTNEETISLLLPDALLKIEAMPGGGTLFEHVKEQAVRGMLDARRSVRELAERLGVQLPLGLDGDSRLPALRVHQLQALGIEPSAFAMTLADESVGTVIASVGSKRLLAEEAREQLFTSQTVEDLAEAVGGRVPAGLASGDAITQLRLVSLFRFLTVGALVGYVEQLVALAGERPECRAMAGDSWS